MFTNTASACGKTDCEVETETVHAHLFAFVRLRSRERFQHGKVRRERDANNRGNSRRLCRSRLLHRVQFDASGSEIARACSVNVF